MLGPALETARPVLRPPGPEDFRAMGRDDGGSADGALHWRPDGARAGVAGDDFDDRRVSV
ncbi:hypothetical protein AB4037_00385 [Labrys sp. KB_33_2]|uniref:hypothetical protein n=1 Tax=Labrys sp. KB_33_2 TaxID=3237479 RepID=UPI003F8F927B